MPTCIVSTRENVLDEWARMAPVGHPFMRLRPVGPGDSWTDLPSGPGVVFVLDGATTALDSLIGEVQAASANARVLVVTDELTPPRALALLRLGVKGILTHGSAALHLAPAVEALARGRMWVPRRTLADFLDSLLVPRRTVEVAAAPRPLSRREEEVLRALLENLSNKGIGRRLNISEKTVKFYVSSLLSRFGVPRRTDLILRFLDPRSSRERLFLSPEDR